MLLRILRACALATPERMCREAQRGVDDGGLKIIELAASVVWAIWSVMQVYVLIDPSQTVRCESVFDFLDTWKIARVRAIGLSLFILLSHWPSDSTGMVSGSLRQATCK